MARGSSRSTFGAPVPFAVDAHTGLHLVRCPGALSLPDGSDCAWCVEDPESFIDIVSDRIDEVIGYSGCRWSGPSPQVAAVMDGRCYGIGIARRKVFEDGQRAVNLTYAVRKEMRGAGLGAVLSALAVFDLHPPATSHGVGWPSDLIVNVQTRVDNPAAIGLAIGMGLKPAPLHGFVAPLRAGGQVEFLGFDDDYASFRDRMTVRLSERVVLGDAADPLFELLEPFDRRSHAEANDDRPRQRQ